MIIDTSHCATKIIDVHGQTGADWIERLPALLAGCAARWSLEIGPPFPVPSYNYVAPAVGPGGAAWVLKAGVPHGELWSEIDALRVFDGSGCVRLLDADRERGVLLLERVRPGYSLNAAAEENRIAALVGVMRRLWRPLPEGHPFRTVADLARGLEKLRAAFDGGYGPFPPLRVERAASLFRELAGETSPPTIIHGDMNPGNVLWDVREGWLAIDPKGYAGNPLYDVATFLNDPPGGLSVVELERFQTQRVAALAGALETSREEILAWAEAHAVLSAWWSYEDHGRGWEPVLALAELYEGMLRSL